jgi:polyisoprenoid-binding protein YceI
MRTALTLALIASAAIAMPLIAQRGGGGMPMMHSAGWPAEVTAGTYVVEPNHTQTSFTVGHMGISPFTGVFAGGSGRLTLDPKRPAATSLQVSIPVASVHTTSTKLDEELNSADWLDSAKFPTATFTSSKVTPTGAGTARVNGTLTLHGVSKPAVLDVSFFGAAANPMSKKASVGFTGRMTVKRSDFGVSKYVPMVSDDTTLTINAAFEKQ